MAEDTTDVLVIGAGMAGLTAARTLAEAGLQVLVLEAQNRIGGRIWTEHVANETIELGAEFVHGRPPELWALIEEAGLETYESTGSQACFEDGKLSGCGDEMEKVFEPLEKLEDFQGPDLNFAEYLDRKKTPPGERRPMIGYVEGFNAADHREISAASLGFQQKAEDSIQGDRTFHVRGGYDQLPLYLAQRIAEYGGKVLTGEIVTDIDWQPGKATIRTATNILTTRQAIVSIPLEALKSGKLAITPQPNSILHAASRLRMGQARRFTLIFRERFWQNLDPHPALKSLSFLFAFSEIPPVWWTPHPEPSNTITGWIGGPRSSALTGLDENELARRACETLAKIFGIDSEKIRKLLQKIYTHDWQQDVFTLGAYSYVSKGGLDASKEMTIPVANTLFFAGEHTDVTGHWGTVHAAVRSGLRVASQILAIRNQAPETGLPKSTWLSRK